jgi:hypothetical protein
MPILAMLVMNGCDDSERTARLQKENAELKAQLNQKNVTRNYDLQARCSKEYCKPTPMPPIVAGSGESTSCTPAAGRTREGGLSTR